MAAPRAHPHDPIMGKDKFRWGWHRAKDLARESCDELHAVNRMLHAQNRKDVHAKDLRFLRKLLADYGGKLAPYHVEKLKESIAYVEAYPAHTLGPSGKESGWRGFWYRIARALHAGVYVPPSELPPEVLQRVRTKKVLRAKRRQEILAQRPAWQGDPSLLPAKPPGMG